KPATSTVPAAVPCHAASADSPRPGGASPDAPPSHPPRPTGVADAAGGGRPGASALAEYHRRRGLERAAWGKALPGHLLLVVVVAIVSWFVGAVFTGPLPDSLVWAPAIGWAVWTCRPHTTPDTKAWRTGARGEQATGRLLGPLQRRG
ncbi:MAG: hypothetical protein ACRDZO_11245, partial [Egibacteraceae bacterium]